MIHLRTWDGEMLLDCPGGPNAITNVLITGRPQGQSERRRHEDGSGGLRDGLEDATLML